MHKTTPTSIIEALLKFWYTWSNLELRVGTDVSNFPFGSYFFLPPQYKTC